MDKGNSTNLIMKQKKWIQKCEIENKCDICEKLFSSKQILKDHIAYVHGEANDGNFQKCNICNKLCSWRQLKRHTKWCKRHHYCHKCKQSFSNSQDFNEHIHESHDERCKLSTI